MTLEKVYSPIDDKFIKHNLKNSLIWKECYHETDNKPKGKLFCYYIKFDGLKPIQIVKIEQL